MSPLRQRKRAFVALGLVGLLAAGCVKQGPPGVAISPLKADIVFGVKEAVAAATPANFVAPVVVDESMTQDAVAKKFDDVPEFTPLPTRAPLPGPGQVKSFCPDAALTAFPAVGADSYVRGLPAEGVYRFKEKLTIGFPGKEPFTFDLFNSVAIRRVVQNPTKAYEFTYQMVEPNMKDGGVTVTSFLVNSNPAVVRNVNQAPIVVGVVPTPGVDQTVTPPTDEPGIFMTGFENQSYDGQTKTGGFLAAAKGVKFLPLDEAIVKPGQTFDSVGIDKDRGSAFRNNGTVGRKVRVDACGEIVEGWQVSAVQSYTEEPLTDRTVIYNIATQLGALMIAKSYDFTDSSGVHWTIELSLANPKPSPLPESLK